MAQVRQVIAWTVRGFLCGVLALGSLSTASADIVTTEDALNSAQIAKTRERVKALTQRPELVMQLKALGVMPDQLEARVDAMTDAEVLALAGKLDNLPAGGALSNNQLILIIILIIVLVIVL
jgi:hypothetical protein